MPMLVVASICCRLLMLLARANLRVGVADVVSPSSFIAATSRSHEITASRMCMYLHSCVQCVLGLYILY